MFLQANDDGTDSWLKRFSRLAQAVLKNDLERRGELYRSMSRQLSMFLGYHVELSTLVGYIKPDEARWLITEYNDIYGLQFDPLFIEASIKKNSAADGTHIDHLLKDLLQSAQLDQRA